jgi:hypothetical protein
MRKVLTIAVCVSLVTAVSGRETKPLVLRGRAVDSSARSVAEAEVAAYVKAWVCYNGPEYAELLGPIAKTDADGRFALNVRIHSQYDTFIVARKHGLAYAWDGLNYSSNERAEGDFTLILEKPGVLSGRLIESDGSPVARAKVRAVPKNHYLSRLRQRPILGPEEWFTTKTGDHGKFTFNDFAPDVSADFMVEAPGRSLVHWFTTHWLNGCGYEVGKPEVELILPPKTTVKGRVVDQQTGAGIAGVGLMLQPYDTRENEYLYYHYRFTSGQDGSFSVDAVPPGKHLLRVVTPKDQTGEWVGKNTLIDIARGETAKTVTVKVEKGGLIQVLARDDKTRRPLSSVQVQVHNKQFAASASDFGFFRNAFTGPDGTALVRSPVGQCNVTAWNTDHLPSNPMPVMVKQGKTSPTEIPLHQTMRISGTVTDESHWPVSGAFVAVHPFGDEAFTDNLGNFTFRPDHERKPEILLARHIDRNLAAAVRIEDPTRPLRVTLVPALSAVGEVTDTDGKGVAAARVILTTSISSCLSNFTEVIADETGSYQIKALAPEQPGLEYQITTVAAGYGTKDCGRVSVQGSPPGPVRIPTISLTPADVSISGVVVDANGHPAVRIPIFLGSPRGSDQPSRTTATDAQGRFVINRVCKGPLTIGVNFHGSPGGSGNLVAEGGDQNVKIVLGQKEVQTHRGSLLGKPLPELTQFGLRPVSEMAGGKQVLLCFWDVNQRPSRNCVEQLSRRANLLAGKNVCVVLAQSPPVPDRMIVDWLRKYRVAFPTGRVTTGPAVLSKNWGVQSLPWLVLTDARHIVTAEGFALHELNEKIKEADNAKR